MTPDQTPRNTLARTSSIRVGYHWSRANTSSA